MIIAALTAVLCAGLASCSETNNEVEEFPDWKKTNEEYFDRTYNQAVAKAETDNTVKVIRSYALNDDSDGGKNKVYNSYDHIVVNVLNEGHGSGCPLYTDSVKVHYSGRLLPSASYPQGYLFDQSWTGNYNLDTMVPVKFGVAGVVTGFATALQHMHIGDRWQVIIPYQLGYDSSDTPGAAYSTLVFDVTLVAYYRWNDTSWKQSRALNEGEDSTPRGRWIYQ